jgi:hypothetical protein
VTMHAPYDYVAGDFPKGMEFRSTLGDKQIRKIKDHGGKVIILPCTHGHESVLALTFGVIEDLRADAVRKTQRSLPRCGTVRKIDGDRNLWP